MPVQKMLDELNELRHDVLELAHSVENAVTDVHEPHLDRIDRAERCRQMVAHCQRLLVLYQPVAADFRQVMSILEIAAEYERVANQASAIAEWTDSPSALAVPLLAALQRIAEAETQLCQLALEVAAQRTPTAIRRVWRAYTELTDLVAIFTDRLTGAMKADPMAVEPGIGLFALVQSFRRIADAAVEFAEGGHLTPENSNDRSYSDGAWPRSASSFPSAV
ncbi:phosphate signaling complex PhoU family protein [Frigoriglobus tundricola]|uniref:PhoU domain-containing protein n=1 Tax=Frigoriglobus tundricola TaxID=2774151 RepID=A0A6M5Z206_9BACT|nr:PhoU domain-containing protein [Frigoriglobus tundricola]QJX00229.1 hypothetical protein FTUN_7853 [Frigoriglobus tundricola]